MKFNPVQKIKLIIVSKLNDAALIYKAQIL